MAQRQAGGSVLHAAAGAMDARGGSRSAGSGSHQPGGLGDLISEWVAADNARAGGVPGLEVPGGSEAVLRRPLRPVQARLAPDMASLQVPQPKDKWARSSMWVSQPPFLPPIPLVIAKGGE